MGVNSMEIRWFFKGEPAESLKSGFLQAHLGLREETRSDDYPADFSMGYAAWIAANR